MSLLEVVIAAPVGFGCGFWTGLRASRRYRLVRRNGDLQAERDYSHERGEVPYEP